MAFTQYRTVVSFDTSLVDLGKADSNISSGLKGLHIDGIKITAGQPDATKHANRFIPAAKIYNAVDGTEWRNTGTSAAPVWSLVETSSTVPGTSLAYNAIATAGNVTFTAAQFVDAIVDRNGSSAARTDVTPTAALIVALIPGAIVGSAFTFFYRNTSATQAEDITLTGGTGVTITGNANVYQGQSKQFIGRVTNATAGSEAVTVYEASIIPDTEQLQIVSTLSSAQILALHTTPINMIANVASKTILIDEIIFTMTFATGAYTGGNNVEFRYTNGAGTKVSSDVTAATLNISGGLQQERSLGLGTPFFANAPVVAVVPVANPAAGGGSASVFIRYRLV